MCVSFSGMELDHASLPLRAELTVGNRAGTTNNFSESLLASLTYQSELPKIPLM